MYSMNWTKIIFELTDRAKGGITQTELAKRCGCSQATISDLLRGEIRKPSFTIGQKLVALHAAMKINEAA